MCVDVTSADRPCQSRQRRQQQQVRAAWTLIDADAQPPLRQVRTRTHTHGWRRGVVVSGGVRRMNEVNARRAQLVLGWVTVFGRVYRLGM